MQGEAENLCNIFDRKPEGNRPLTRPRNRWEDNTEKDLKETEFLGVEWIHLIRIKTDGELL
jgi:hypothetical protein